MAGKHVGTVFQRIERIFAAGSVAGLSEGELLQRFATRGDGAAFEAIVARHGPMVLAICRQVLRDPNDIDDAFQATFLVLVRKAASLRHRELLGNWLFGVASRVALHSRSVATRRRSVEGSPDAARVPNGAGPGTVLDDESAVILPRELRDLPEKYRVAVLLCYMDGLTHEEAARQLGWPLGTVKGRLARAREMLRKRLSRRGITLSAPAVSAAVARHAEAAVPAALVQATLRAAQTIATGRGLAAGVIAANVAALMKGASDAMFLNSLKLTAMVLVAGAMTMGVGVWAFQAPGARAGRAPQTAAPAAPKAPVGGTGSVPVRAGREAIAVLAPQVAARDTTPKTRAVLSKLEENISMSFANETPLEDVLKYIKAATQGPNDSGIPIYLDPAGLAAAKTTTTAPVNLDLEGVPLKTTLRLLLKQLNLAYCVIEGMVIISSVDGVLDELKEAEAAAEVAAKLPPLPPPAARTAKAKEAAPDKPVPAGLPAERFENAQAGPPPDPGTPLPSNLEKALDAPVSLSIAKDTSLADAFKSIKNVARLPDGGTLPVYIDPAVAGRGHSIRNDFDVADVPLRTVLSLLLSQVGIAWDIQDGLLIVSDIQELQNYRRIAAHFSTQFLPGSDGISPWNPSPEIQAALDAPITLAYPRPTPLDDVLKPIRESSKGAGKASISLFYGPPVRIQTLEDLGSPPGPDAVMRPIGELPVTIDVKEVPLRTCLALLLGQQPPFLVDKLRNMGGHAWPPLDGRLIDGVLVIGARDWVRSIQLHPQGFQRGPGKTGQGMRGGQGMM